MACLSLALTACPKPSPPLPDAAVAATQILDSGSAPPDLEVSVTVSLPDGGTLPLDFTQPRPALDPAAKLLLSTNLPLSNYRIRVFDEADRAMPSDDRAEERPHSLRYEIALSEPLRSGNRYAIVLDAQTGSSMTDASGRTHRDLRLELQVNGEKGKPPLKAKPAKKKPKRRRG